jgi:hypothetical protein
MIQGDGLHLPVDVKFKEETLSIYSKRYRVAEFQRQLFEGSAEQPMQKTPKPS